MKQQKETSITARGISDSGNPPGLNATKYLTVLYTIVCLTLFSLISTPSAFAYPTYSANSDTNTGNCAGCHGDFNGGNYSSLTADDPANWGMNLMQGHIQRYNLQCVDCHESFAPGAGVSLNSSSSTTGVTCSTCHGREEDITSNDGAFGGPTPGRGDGLRAHHAQAGITVCAGCHSADTTPVGEDVPPATYLAIGIDPCNENAYGSVTFGNAGLDNDGDGLADMADPDCAGGVNTPPLAIDDTATTTQDTPITIDVLLNDSDPDGDAITINDYDAVSAFNGTVVCDTSGGLCTYTPALGFTGEDTFTYNATDGTSISADRATVTINVTQPPNGAPVCSDIKPVTGQVGTELIFSATASDPDGDPLTYSWDFDDGVTSTQASPSHTYATAGSYVVVLEVSDNQGASSTCNATVVISETPPVNQPPSCSGITPSTGQVDVPIGFSANASDPDNDPLSYSWDFGDGGTSTETNPNHTYTAADTYTVSLSVSDGQGGTAQCTADVTVSMQPPMNNPPVCSGIAPDAGQIGIPVAFSANASDPDGDTLTYSWDFGDGGSGSGAAPTHTYSAAGSYTVRLTVEDGLGGTSSCSTTVTISPVVQPSDGQALYNQNCAFCHGDPQDPSGMGPVAFTVPGARSCSIKGAIYNPVPWGVEQMASLFKGTLSDADIEAIAGYLNSFTVSGEQRYNSMCARCHGPGGNGQGLANESVAGESAGEIMEAIREESVMRFLSCLPNSHPTDIQDMANFLRGQTAPGGAGEEDHGDLEANHGGHSYGDNNHDRSNDRKYADRQNDGGQRKHD